MIFLKSLSSRISKTKSSTRSQTCAEGSQNSDASSTQVPPSSPQFDAPSMHTPSDSDRNAACGFKERGNQSFKLGFWELAVENFTDAIKRDPTVTTFYTNRALAYMKQEKWKEVATFVIYNFRFLILYLYLNYLSPFVDRILHLMAHCTQLNLFIPKARITFCRRSILLVPIISPCLQIINHS